MTNQQSNDEETNEELRDLLTHQASPVHTLPSEKAGWDTVQNGEILNHEATKADAMAVSRDKAIKDKTEHKIHKLDGTTTDSDSY